VTLIRTRLTNNEHGFTLIEALITIFLFSVIAVVVAGGVITGQQLVNKVIVSTHESFKSVQLDGYLRGMVAKVKVPYWLPNVKYVYTYNSLEFPYLDGKPDKFLVIKNEDDGFYIGYRDDDKNLPEAKEELVFFGPFWQSKLDVTEDKGIVQSIALNFTSKNGDQATDVYTVFASNPFWYTGP
jgi:prepilin-type N-terminal cleavage/methylation domain-containing protein